MPREAGGGAELLYYTSRFVTTCDCRQHFHFRLYTLALPFTRGDLIYWTLLAVSKRQIETAVRPVELAVSATISRGPR